METAHSTETVLVKVINIFWPLKVHCVLFLLHLSAAFDNINQYSTTEIVLLVLKDALLWLQLHI